MKVSRLAITGDNFMINRHKFLLESLALEIENLILVPQKEHLKEFIIKHIKKHQAIRFWVEKNARTSNSEKTIKTYIERSMKSEVALKRLFPLPDLVFHFYGLYSPFWEYLDIPYVIYLDYTMALAHENWKPWAPFKDEKKLGEWIDCEKKSYQNARHVFTKSQNTKDSLLKDYQLTDDCITVVHSAGQFNQSFGGRKTFGSQKILFNGSDFERKGGNLLLKAFRVVRSVLPGAELNIVGSSQNILEPGVKELGFLNKEKMITVFLEADLLVAPSLCEPLGLFTIEGMSYGLPCIVANQDGMPELVDEGKNGYVLKTHDPEELAQKIIELLTNLDLLTYMSDYSKLKVKEQFNWNVIARKMCSLISTF